MANSVKSCFEHRDCGFEPWQGSHFYKRPWPYQIFLSILGRMKHMRTCLRNVFAVQIQIHRSVSPPLQGGGGHSTSSQYDLTPRNPCRTIWNVTDNRRHIGGPGGYPAAAHGWGGLLLQVHRERGASPHTPQEPGDPAGGLTYPPPLPPSPPGRTRPGAVRP